MRLFFILLMDCPGFEPGTNRLKAEYSTIELAVLYVLTIGSYHISLIKTSLYQ